jgi:hypothetical protein
LYFEKNNEIKTCLSTEVWDGQTTDELVEEGNSNSAKIRKPIFGESGFKPWDLTLRG